MSGGSKKPAAALAALLLALVIAACGGDSSSTTATTETAGGDGGQGPSAASSTGKEGPSEKAIRIPKHHHDSGGGSAQYRVKGGDNSIPNFGSEASAEELDEVAAALHGFLDARALGHWDEACSYLSERVVDSFRQIAKGQEGRAPSCGRILEALTNPAAKRELIAEAASADVGSVRIEGDRGFLIYDSSAASGLAIPAIREGDVWKVDGVAPVQIG